MKIHKKHITIEQVKDGAKSTRHFKNIEVIKPNDFREALAAHHASDDIDSAWFDFSFVVAMGYNALAVNVTFQYEKSQMQSSGVCGFREANDDAQLAMVIAFTRALQNFGIATELLERHVAPPYFRLDVDAETIAITKFATKKGQPKPFDPRDFPPPWPGYRWDGTHERKLRFAMTTLWGYDDTPANLLQLMGDEVRQLEDLTEGLLLQKINAVKRIISENKQYFHGDGRGSPKTQVTNAIRALKEGGFALLNDPDESFSGFVADVMLASQLDALRKIIESGERVEFLTIYAGAYDANEAPYFMLSFKGAPPMIKVHWAWELDENAPEQVLEWIVDNVMAASADTPLQFPSSIGGVINFSPPGQLGSLGFTYASP